jgi:hypothetical protein
VGVRSWSTQGLLLRFARGWFPGFSVCQRDWPGIGRRSARGLAGGSRRIGSLSLWISEVDRPRSPPTRGRGSKRRAAALHGRQPQVAPYTGAWIETQTCCCSCLTGVVAPYTGAWIETSSTQASRCGASVAPYTGAWIETSPSSRSRLPSRVAPYTGAWIETRTAPRHPAGRGGRPLHGGVDRNGGTLPIDLDAQVSPPTRGRGSKLPHAAPVDLERRVAPYTGAWIETIVPPRLALPRPVAPYTGAWIETITPC